MPPRRRAKVSIPKTPGLDRDGQKVGEHRNVSGSPFEDTAIRKTWADSLKDPEIEQMEGWKARGPSGPDYWFEADVAEVDFDVHFRLGVTDEGALVVTGMILGDPAGTQPITTSNLHRLPIGAIYDAISRLDEVTTAVAENARRFKGEIPKRGGQKTPDEEFGQVATMYRECLIERPNDPIKCVAEKLGVSSATASRRVSRARDLGLLRSDSQERQKQSESRRMELEKRLQAIGRGEHLHPPF